MTLESNFDEDTLEGRSTVFAGFAERIRMDFGFDFVALGLTAFPGAPLHWKYASGATSQRYARISLAPGHGIGGIVVKSGKPMVVVDIDAEIDAQQYSSFPIVFAEDLHSFCALPVRRNGVTVGALLLAFRQAGPENSRRFDVCIEGFGQLDNGYELVTEGAIALTPDASTESGLLPHNEATRVIFAQEEERRRISREIHDGVSQELLGASIMLSRLEDDEGLSETSQQVVAAIKGTFMSVFDQLHNLSVDLRPSTLDHFGLVAALRSQAEVYQKAYGCSIVFDVEMATERFSPARETQVYRICQEAMLNACKYSGCDRVDVGIREAAGTLSVTVSDAGCGFNVENPEIKGTGCGMPGMQERADLIGATVSVTSDERGTVVALVCPLR